MNVIKQDSQKDFGKELLERDFTLRKKDPGYIAFIAKSWKLFRDLENKNNEKLTQYLIDVSMGLGGDSYLSDGMLLWGREINWIRNSRFLKCLKVVRPLPRELRICWRTHVLCLAAMQAFQTEGDFFEFGCLNGFSGAVIRNYCDKYFQRNPLRQYFWFDLFVESATQKSLKIDHSQSEKTARNRASLFSNINIVKGDVRSTYLDDSNLSSREIAFAHFDLNNFELEFEIIKHTLKLTSQGSVLVFDDFGMSPFRRQNRNYSKFFDKLSIPILELPTGQGIVIIP